ncbi:ABC transporter ATP-binding protein [Bacillus sp. FJAT-47783]|uniref:ABC transporter ATP-binding protein n=1 Tax=Bacillus sp. FJAT-47783 TaxID=2922712 RepID=UPI001FADFF84|nr:ABC transporter ATP-binding protein [Bacillus sp. FJAT-47783]
MDHSVIQLDNVSKSFRKKEVLKNVTFNVNRGEIFGLLGPSGSGKTTLVKCIIGMESTSIGTVHVLGTKVPNLDLTLKIGFMAQSDALYNDLTAAENVDFFASLYGLKGTQKRKRIEHVLAIVDLIEDKHKKIHQFSGGMKRRLSLAISLLHEPEVLILDEPTVGIDPILRQSVWNELEQLRENGTTIVVTTHVMDEAEKCTRLAMIREGKIMAIGRPSELKQNVSVNSIEDAFLHYGGALI